MKLKFYSLLVVLFLINSVTYAQNLKPFTPRFDQDLKGDILLIGNNTLSRKTNSTSTNVPYNGNSQNGGINMQFIDIDVDATTFNSSSADLVIPSASSSCYRIKYAGLYWAGILQSNTRTGINNVKLKLPGSSTYTNITGTIIHDDPNNPIGDDDNKVYACYYDITSLVTGLANPQGTYTVADVVSSTGYNGGTGLSAGWSIFVVYEDPNLPAKSIVSFDGFSGIGGATTLNIPISGFRTIPSGPVRAKFAFSCLEGDYSITGDYLEINGTKIATSYTNRPRTTNNFFNSTINDINGIIAARSPNSENTLGYDAGIISNFNNSNAVLGNNATSANIKLGSGGDVFFYFFNAFAVDIIEPQIVLTKTIEDNAGNPIADGSAVNLGQSLTYVIGFQNIGNDDATNVTIRDVLPVNVIYNHPTDLVLPTGVTVASYNAATREIILNVDPSLVNVGDPRYTIRIKVRVVANCYELIDACENRIINQAFASYQGVINTTPITDDPSLSTFSACNLGTPSPTNFIGNIDDCVFSQNVIMCGTTVQLTAPNGYSTYTWSGPSGATITAVSGTNNQSVVVNQAGTYTVLANAPDPCIDIPVTFNVVTFGVGVTNPVIPYADEVVTCPNDGKPLPYIYLCGVNDSQTILTNIADATSIVWQKLDETSCAAANPVTCANETASCVWNQIGTGSSFTVAAEGQYRIVINYPGGCSSIFYFNVFKNLLDPQVVATDIICNTPGCITINNVPSSGYEFSLSTPTGAPTNVWQSSNVFCNITTAGSYTVLIRQTGFTNGCIVSVPDISVRARNFTVTSNVTDPLCFGDKGSISLAINEVNAQYYFYLYSGNTTSGTLVSSAGPQAANNYTFSNLTPGQTYTWSVNTDNGCTQSGTLTLSNPKQLIATSSVTKPLSCTPGEITVSVIGGTEPYVYYVNTTPPSGAFQTTNTIEVNTPGTYTITVVDANNCQTVTTQVVSQVLPPAYTVSSTNILCNNANNGTITFNVTNANGNALLYSINNGTTWSNSNVFTGLSAGTYTALVQYTTGTAVCTTTSETITISNPNPLTIAAVLNPVITCPAPGVITVNASGGTGTLQYSIDGINFQSSNVFTVSVGGTYTITVRDANNCTATTTVTAVTPIGPSDLYLKDQVKVSCDNVTGQLNVDVVPGFGGQPPLTFQIVAPIISPILSSGNFAGLSPGAYTFQVTDKNGCTYQEVFVLESVAPPVITPNLLNDVRCFGTNTGNASFTITGLPNKASYSYSITPAPGTSASGTTPNGGSTTVTIPLTNYPAGTYTLTLVYQSCTITSTVTIGGPSSELAAVLNSTPVTCSANGTITVNASGGWGGYTYTISPAAGTQSGNTFTNVPPGNYTITTTDANGCQDIDTINLTAPTQPTLALNATSDFCYDTTNGASIYVTASNGVAPYQFSINGGAYVASNTPTNGHTFTNLTPGTYTISVRDAYGCTNATTFTQTINPQLTINAVLTKDFDCTATPSATISVTAAGGYPGYTYQVSYNGGAYTAVSPVPSSNPFVYTIPTTNPGTYQFQVTDIRGCIASSGVVTVPALLIPTATLTVTNVSCNGGTNGSVTITPSSGTAPYQISFNGAAFSSSTTYGGLTAGTYNYIVRDAKQCTFNGTVTVTEPTAISLSALLTSPYTCTSSGVITVTASGGTGTLSYSINGTTFQASNVFTVSSAGTYTITVKDANGCTATTSVVVAPLTPPTDISFSATAVTCTSGNTSNVTLTVTGGALPLTYQIIAPTAGIAQTSNVFNNLAPGTYTFLVTDAKNCTYQESFTINPLPALTVNAVVNNNVQCVGSATGSIRFTVSGYSPTYNYTITPNGFPGDSGTNIGVASVTVNNLPANTYTITIVNPSTGCTTSTTVTISAPAVALSATLDTKPVTCLTNGSVTVNATGGWGGYTYAISPVAGTQSGNTFTNVPAGSYNITIVDANGCSITRPFTLAAPTQPTIALEATSDFCYDTTNGASLYVTASNGVAPYQFSLNGGAFVASNTPTNGHTFSNLTPGTYTITVRDAYGCTNAVIFTQTINPQLTLNTVLTKDFDCSTTPNAVISGTINGGYPGYTYQVSYNGGSYAAPTTVTGSTFTYSIPTTNPGTYQILVTDIRGCTVQSGVITIPALQPVTVSTSQVNVLCFGDATGSVTFTPGGGVAPYQINFNGTGFSANTTYSNLAAGTYTYVVRDSKLCTISGSVTITQNPQITYTSNLVPITCDPVSGNTTLGQICVQGVSGGVAPYTYTLVDLSNGNAPQTFTAATTGINHCFTNLDYGFYDLIVTDANSCSITTSNIAIASPVSDLQVTATVLPAGDCLTGATVKVDAISTFGTGGPYYFSLYPNTTTPPAGAGWIPEDTVGSGSATFSGLLTGVTYSFIVWDSASNCYYYAQANTATASNSNMTSNIDVINNVTCKGSADANVSIEVSNYAGTSVSWQIFNSLTTAPITPITNVTGLPAGGPYPITNIGPMAPGSYFVLLTETSGPNNGCSVSSAVFNVVESVNPLSVVASAIKNDNCNTNAGVITAVAQGGTAPYTFSIDGVTYGSSSTFNVESGTYTIYVKDAYGCIASTPTTITVNLDTTPNADVSLINACAVEGNFSVNITLNTAGIAPYTLSVDGGAFQTVTFPYMVAGLSSGSHTFEVKDANGCGETETINILTPMAGSVAITALPTCANNDGSIVITATGGSGNYAYSISPVAGTISGNVISGLPAGNYTVTITDTTTNCTFNVPVTLGAPTPVTFTASSTLVSCFGGSDGTITVTLDPTNDNPVYTYEIIAGPIIFSAQTSNIFTGLPTGTYTVQVNSGRGCFATLNVPVNQPTDLV
ncbi:beta strand repeat-containing protein, partial [Flavobacterium luminosum]|nr:hypothetical protein [Flavobacterium sp. HXWNR70]